MLINFITSRKSTQIAAICRYHLYFFCHPRRFGCVGCKNAAVFLLITDSKSSFWSGLTRFSKCTTERKFSPSLPSNVDIDADFWPDTSQVKVSFKYPSKHVNKTLSSAHGVPSQIAGTIMNCQPLRQHVIKKVLKGAGLCSKSNPSMLRKTEKADGENFDFERLCNEWREKAPVFYAFLLTSCINKITKSNTWFGSLALACRFDSF